MQSIKAKAFTLLSKKSYFTKELRAKLLEKGYPEKDIEILISELKNQNLLDDHELAARYVKLQQAKGYGARVIIQKLRQKAGPIEVEIEDGEIESLIRKKYLRKLPDDRNKVIAALLRRGFSYDLINKALDLISEEME